MSQSHGNQKKKNRDLAAPRTIPRILIVDDSPETRFVYKHFMSRGDFGYSIEEAETVADGLKKLSNEHFDCIILDFCLPDADGLELLAEITDGSGECSTPVVMITGEGSETVAVEAMKLGAKDYLIKDAIDADSLVAAVENALEKAQAQREQELYRKKLEQQSVTDPLTGLHNRRYLVKQLELELNRGARYRTPLCVLMIDLDHFKQVNDHYGHVVGDQVLQAFSAMLTRIARSSDIVVRYGGEEFCAVLTNTELDGGCYLAERFCEKARKLRHKDASGNEFTVTCSIGIAESRLGKVSFDELIQKGDQALYQAKHQGRDQTVVYREIEAISA